MSQVFNGQTGGGGGLTSVATDATLTGDGTVLDPLSVVPTLDTTAYLAAELPNLGILYQSPFLAFPDTVNFTETIPSASFDLNASGIRPLFSGFMRVTCQITLTSIAPVAADSSVVITYGLTENRVPVPVAIGRSSDNLNIDNGLLATQSVSFDIMMPCVANTIYYLMIETTGDVVDFEIMGDEGRTTIIVERIA